MSNAASPGVEGCPARELCESSRFQGTSPPDLWARATAERVRIVIFSCFALQLLIALATIPPWQNPDEPQHLMTVRQVLRYGSDFSITVLDKEAESAIVESMAEHGWWTHYGLVTPNPLPSSFAEGPGEVVDAYFGPPDGGSRLYYQVVAGLFEALGIENLVGQIYAMRVLSALAALLTIACVWAGTRAALGCHAALATTISLGLQPQFVLVSATASPDALVNLAGGIIWWQSAMLLSSDTPVRLLPIWVSAIAAFLTRRVGAPLLVVALAATCIWLWWRRDRFSALRLRGVALAVVPVVLLLAVSWRFLGADFARAAGWVAYNPIEAVLSADASRFPVFVDALFRTFWLAAGWVRYLGPSWWYALTVLVSGVACVGLVRLPWRSCPLAVFAAVMVLIQIGATVGLYFGILGISAQGRYLFPVLPAILCLIWLGWSAAVRRPQLAAVTFIFLIGLLNTSAWLFVVFPAYA